MNIPAYTDRERCPPPMGVARRFALPVIWALMLGMSLSSPTRAQQPMLGGDGPRLDGPISVQEAVQTALKNNLEVLASQAEASSARQETRAARAMTRPQVSANTYLTVGSMANIFGTSPNVTPVNALSVPANGFADQNLTLMAPIYTGGRLENLVRAASGRERAAGAGIATAQADAALMVKDA